MFESIEAAKVFDITVAHFEASAVPVGIKSVFGMQSQMSEHGSTVPFVINIRPAGARHRSASRVDNMDSNRPSDSTAGVQKRVHNLVL
jgi:hypothetical protein